MNTLEQENKIGEELEKLFSFQDRVLSDKKKTLIVEAIMKYNYPYGAVIAGIRKLAGDEMGNVKLNYILASIRTYLEEDETQGCGNCSTGYVLMRDVEGRWFSLLCNCNAGMSKKMTQKVVSWNGEDNQYAKGRMLKKEDIKLGSRTAS